MGGKIELDRGLDGTTGTFIRHELWDLYLPFIGGTAALLYCYLLRQLEKGGVYSYKNMSGALGISEEDLREALAMLIEYDLVGLGNGNKLLINSPKQKNELSTLLEHQAQQYHEGDGTDTYYGANKVLIPARARSSRTSENLFSLVEQEFGRSLRPSEYELLMKIEDTYSKELITEAVSRAVLHQAYNIQYIDSILFNWKAKGIKNLIDVERDDQRFKASKAQRRFKSAVNLKNHHAEQDKTEGQQLSSKYNIIYQRLKNMKS